MISKSFSGGYPVFSVECDNCGDSLPYSFDSFDEAKEDLKSLGWKARKNSDGDWENICTDCLDRESHRRYENGR